MHQMSGRIHQAADPKETVDDHGIVLGRGQDPRHVRVAESRLHAAGSFDFGQREVGADRELPRSTDRFLRGPEEPAGQVVLAEGFGGPERGHHVVGCVRLHGEDHAAQARWRFATGHRSDREQPHIVLVAEQRHARRTSRHNTDQHHLLHRCARRES